MVSWTSLLQGPSDHGRSPRAPHPIANAEHHLGTKPHGLPLRPVEQALCQTRRQAPRQKRRNELHRHRCAPTIEHERRIDGAHVCEGPWVTKPRVGKAPSNAWEVRHERAARPPPVDLLDTDHRSHGRRWTRLRAGDIEHHPGQARDDDGATHGPDNTRSMGVSSAPLPMTSQDFVIGVAGHIDHGKTALVRALTGVDTDRLPEEKARGITIELGFAPLPLPDGRRAAVVDMPGHERFVRTMIAGAGGIDGMLLVVAANEGVMPQTREHLAIAGLVGVRTGVCALSKSDLASDDLRELAVEEIREVLRGSPLDGAPVIPVSARTGAGLDALRDALAAMTVPPRDTSGPVLLPIDRVFVRKGFGVVVTGTLLSGTVRIDDTLLLGPTGPDHRTRTVRVRGLQVHGESLPAVPAGRRVALNLAGVERDDVPRGAWILHPTEVALTRSFDAELTSLPSTRRNLPRRTRLEIDVGTTHAVAGIALLEGDTLAPGARALARVTSDRPLALRPGERLVLRGPASLAGVGSTVGGLTVIRPVVERVRRRAVALDRARRALEGDPAARARVELEAVGARGLTAAELVARAGYRAGPRAADDGVVLAGADRYLGRAYLDALGREILQALSAFHGKNSAEPGLGRRALSHLGPDLAVDTALDALLAQGKVVRMGDVIARAGWKPRSVDEVPYTAQVRAALARAGLAPPRLDELAASCGASIRDISRALERLVASGHVVKISSELYVDATAMGDLEARLLAYLTAHGTIDAQGFKELSGVTRKYAIPYAEHFDAKKLTLRIGDVRKLRGR